MGPMPLASERSITGDHASEVTEAVVHAELDALDVLFGPNAEGRRRVDQIAGEAHVLAPEHVVITFEKDRPGRREGPFDAGSEDPALAGGRRLAVEDRG